MDALPERCDWAGGSDGHCFGEVRHVKVEDGHGSEAWACKRHHNLIVRRWHRSVKARRS